MRSRSIIASVLICVLLFACKKKDNQQQQVVNHNPPPITDTTQVMGYNLLSKICGIWDGGVTSTTALGSYPEWIVDFRPISAAQVSSKNELDTANNIFMSFFITYHKGAYKLAFRNGGSFINMLRTSYMEIDSVSETGNQSYYRFVDFVQGAKRTLTEVIFKQDSLIIQSFTNKGIANGPLLPHMQWRAKLQDNTSCQAAITHFNFPQKVLIQNFDTTFNIVSESIYYQNTGDPYPASAQPYVGQTNIELGSDYALSANHKLFVLITTQPLISNFAFNQANMIYRSRYVILDATRRTFTFNMMHPGTYYVYAYYDANGDGIIDSGDYVSAANATFILNPGGTVTGTANIDFQVP